MTFVPIVIWANKAIIKNDSLLGAAHLLRPRVDRLGDHGCQLTGDHVVQELTNVRVTYGCRTPADYIEGSEMVRRLDAVEESAGLVVQRSMPQGRYNGHGGSSEIRR